MSTLNRREPIRVPADARPVNGDGRADAAATVEDVLGAFHIVRAAVLDLMIAAGADPTKTRESARQLGLNRGLAWRLNRVVCAPDMSAAVSDVPGPASMQRFFDACRDRGASPEAIQEASRAIEVFERAVDGCSGDRKTLAMLLANRTDQAASSEQERGRKKLFEGACSVWGVQAQIRFVTVFLFPSRTDPGQLDAGHVTGFVGFRRLSQRPWPMSYEAVHDKQGKFQPIKKKPLDPRGENEAQRQLLKDFCSPTTPPIQVRESNQIKTFELEAGPVGNEGLTTCVFGSYLQDIYPRFSTIAEQASFMVLLQTPVERVLFDYFVHKEIEHRLPEAMLVNRLSLPYTFNESEFERQSLPITDAPVALPPAESGALYPHIPWYPRMLRFITERIEHPLSEFSGSRFEMTYPPISTMVCRRFAIQPDRSRKV